MMDTTTPVAGDDESQPKQTTEAVEAESTQVDDATSQSNEQPNDNDEAVSNAPANPEPVAETEETQAAPDKTDQEILTWAEKKGLKINPDNPTEVKLARMQLETDRKFHEATSKQSIKPPEPLEVTGDPAYDQIVDRQNANELRMYVRDWFDSNPDMKEHREELTKIAAEKPWLVDMDDVKAHFLANPSREAQLKQQGGREALTNLAQKQQAVPPTANATNSAVYASEKITPENVDQLVAKNDQVWYNDHRDEILQASFGSVRR